MRSNLSRTSAAPPYRPADRDRSPGDALESPRCPGNSAVWTTRPPEADAQSPVQAAGALCQQLRVAGCRFDRDRLMADLLNHGVAWVADRFGGAVPVTLRARAALSTSAHGGPQAGAACCTEAGSHH